MLRHFSSTLLLGFGILTRSAVSTVVWPFKEQLLNLSIPALEYGRLYLVPQFVQTGGFSGIVASRDAEAHSGDDHCSFQPSAHIARVVFHVLTSTEASRLLLSQHVRERSDGGQVREESELVRDRLDHR